ncbi:DUF6507 family protein [Arthrobacter castelli]|uniref:DUF6507 family protein n=1 Tax=Arthrobacter castelli TaxID=271431 RepID=UPI00040C4B18|nr:DUF6507 family protein [Arthrobacter castelli]
MKWDVDPSGVQSILQEVQGYATDYESEFSDMGTSLGAISEAGKSGIIAKALQGLSDENLAPAMKSIAGRTGIALNATAKAVRAYGQGQMEMAANAQENADNAPKLVESSPGGTGGAQPGDFR